MTCEIDVAEPPVEFITERGGARRAIAEDEGGLVKSDTAPKIEATFRNGSLTAISVVLGFSLSFLNRWAGLPGAWNRVDLTAVAAIIIGIVFQIVAVALMLPVRSLVLRRYNRAIRVFLVGLVFVAVGVAIAITGDVAGLGQNVLRG